MISARRATTTLRTEVRHPRKGPLYLHPGLAPELVREVLVVIQ